MFCSEHGTLDYCPECVNEWQVEQVAKLEATIASFAAVDAARREENAKLEATIAELREAARAVVESDADARRQQVTHWKNPTIDALAALLEKNDE